MASHVHTSFPPTQTLAFRDLCNDHSREVECSGQPNRFRGSSTSPRLPGGESKNQRLLAFSSSDLPALPLKLALRDEQDKMGALTISTIQAQYDKDVVNYVGEPTGHQQESTPALQGVLKSCLPERA